MVSTLAVSRLWVSLDPEVEAVAGWSASWCDAGLVGDHGAPSESREAPRCPWAAESRDVCQAPSQGRREGRWGSRCRAGPDG